MNYHSQVQLQQDELPQSGPAVSGAALSSPALLILQVNMLDGGLCHDSIRTYKSSTQSPECACVCVCACALK